MPKIFSLGTSLDGRDSLSSKYSESSVLKFPWISVYSWIQDRIRFFDPIYIYI